MDILTFFSKFGNNPFTWDVGLAVVFLILMTIFLIKHKKNVKLEKMAFPLFYAILYRGKFGIPWMERFAKKHKESVKLFGLISIGIGFVGMVFATILIIYTTYQLIFTPKAASVAPFLPFVEVPVLGYISFSHWLITILVIVIVHEGAHGIVALAHGLKIKNTGFGLFAIIFPFLPAAFVEPDEKKISKSSDVVQHSIYSAGPMSNFVLMIPLWLIALLIISPVEAGITEDLGFSFEVLENESYPAYLAGIPSHVPFNQMNGESVSSASKFYQTLVLSAPGDNFSISYFNESSNNVSYAYSVSLTDNPEGTGSGFLGITGVYEYYDIKDSAKPYAPFFSWFKGLITLMFIITLSLGVINLFPAMLTDGGRMFSLALDKISKHKTRNEKIVAFLGMFFLIVILFSLVTYFTGNPFMLLK